METGVYTITNLINGKMYVGSTSKKFNLRWNDHKSQLRKNTHDNKYLQNSFNKHGIDNFKFEVLEKCLPEYCESTEQFWLNTLDLTNPLLGYNIRSVATNNTGIRRSPEVIENHRRRLESGDWGTTSIPVIQFNKYGEVINRFTSITSASISVGGNSSSIVRVCKGEQSKSAGFYWQYDKGQSTEELAKSIKPLQYLTGRGYLKHKPVVQLTLGGEFIREWDSISEATKGVGLNASSATGQVCKGKRPHSKGFKWKYKE